MSRAGTYPKDVTKQCAGCGSEKVFSCDNREQKRALYFCCDQCAEDYYYRTCKTDNAARSKIGLHYARKGQKWEPGRSQTPSRLRSARISDRALRMERQSDERIHSAAFRRELAALDSEYWAKLRRSYGLASR